MRNPVFVLVVLLMSFGLSSFTIPAASLVGKWRGEDGGEVGIITFDKKGYVSFTVNGETIGGKKYKADGIVFNMTFETNDSVDPHSLDFVITMVEEKVEVARMLGVYKLVDDNNLVINMKFDGSDRPAFLDEESDDQISLTRMK